jgi:hypothetical protein
MLTHSIAAWPAFCDQTASMATGARAAPHRNASLPGRSAGRSRRPGCRTGTIGCRPLAAADQGEGMPPCA